METTQLRSYINILSEDHIHRSYNRWITLLEDDETKTQTKTKTKTPDLDNLFRDTEFHDISAQDNTPNAEKIGRPRRRTTAPNIRAPRGNPNYTIGDIPASATDDDWGDLDATAPQITQHTAQATTVGTDTPPQIASNLPAVKQSSDLATIPQDMVQYVNNIEWTNLTQLPGYAKQMIRNMGRQVFHAFGEMADEDIDTVSSMTNDQEELDAGAGMVKNYGSPVVEEAEIDFGDTMPGYKPTISIWELAGQYYKFVKDDHGDYIYSWEHKDTNKLQQWDRNEVSNQEDLGSIEQHRPSLNTPSTESSDDLDDLINSLY